MSNYLFKYKCGQSVLIAILSMLNANFIIFRYSINSDVRYRQLMDFTMFILSQFWSNVIAFLSLGLEVHTKWGAAKLSN